MSISHYVFYMLKFRLDRNVRRCLGKNLYIWGPLEFASLELTIRRIHTFFLYIVAKKGLNEASPPPTPYKDKVSTIFHNFWDSELTSLDQGPSSSIARRLFHDKKSDCFMSLD